MNIIQILSIVTITLFLLLGFFLILRESTNNVSNRLIGVFFILWGLNLVDGILMISGFYLKHPGLALWEESFVFLYGPIIYFYAISITSDRTLFKWRDLLHLVPAIILFLVIVFTYQLKPAEFKLNIIQSVMDLDQPRSIALPVLIIFIHIFLYVFLAKRKVSKHNEKLKNFYSSFRGEWLNKTLNFLIIILSISLINSALQTYGNPLLFNIGLVALITVTLFFIVSIYFKALEQPLLFIESYQPKQAGSGISEEEKISIAEKAKQALEKDKLFLNPELTIEDLSKSLSLNSRICSMIINDVFGKNFFDLINTYRIEHAKEILKNSMDSKLTILEVMYDSGFNSKSSFNTQFKNKAGITPSEFKRLHS